MGRLVFAKQGNVRQLYSPWCVSTHFMNYVPAGGHEDANHTGATEADHFLKFMNHSSSVQNLRKNDQQFL